MVNNTELFSTKFVSKMIVSLVILTLAVGSRAQICCVPQQWQGTQGTILTVSLADTADPVIVQGDISIAYDAPNKRIAAHMFMTTGGLTTSVIVILNYAEGVQYTISESNCTRTPLKSFAPECIPSDAKLVRSSYLGPPSNKMMINTYTYMRGNLEIAATVTDNTCVPVGEIIQGSTGGEYVMQSVGFSGISAGISKPSVFIPPSSCSSSPLVSVNQNAIHNRILRRYLNLVP